MSLKSRNSGVVMAVCSLYYYLGSGSPSVLIDIARVLARFLCGSRVGASAVFVPAFVLVAVSMPLFDSIPVLISSVSCGHVLLVITEFLDVPHCSVGNRFLAHEKRHTLCRTLANDVQESPGPLHRDSIRSCLCMSIPASTVALAHTCRYNFLLTLEVRSLCTQVRAHGTGRDQEHEDSDTDEYSGRAQRGKNHQGTATTCARLRNG